MKVALSAYSRKSARMEKETGMYLDFLSESNSEVDRKYVYIRNCNGLLGKWNFRTRKFIEGEKDKVY